MSRNDRKESKFKKDREEQLKRDQKAMPVDELPLEDVKYEEEEQRGKNKSKSKKRSSSDGKGQS